jgi:hypothetical protein
MSDRGSFVTEWISCDRCLAAAKRALFAPHDNLRCVQMVRAAERDMDLPIIVGMVKSGGGGMGLIAMDVLTSCLHPDLCHPLRIAVLDENGQNIIAVGNGVDPDAEVKLSRW